jgi:8-oxo-dGTP pyrophosphatase MutT (NUDIX family)/GNAT superfamily N-acetyltransferase
MIGAGTSLGPATSQVGGAALNKDSNANVDASVQRDIERDRAKPREVASLGVFNQAGHMLWGQRRDNQRYTLPGGHLDEGEHPLQGAKRELHEETGIDIGNVPLEHLGSIPVVTHTGKNYLIHAYKVVVPDGTKTSMGGDPDKEVHRWDWHNIQKGLPDKIKGNLHSPRNVVLEQLGLQEHNHLAKAEIDEPLEKSPVEYNTKGWGGARELHSKVDSDGSSVHSQHVIGMGEPLYHHIYGDAHETKHVLSRSPHAPNNPEDRKAIIGILDAEHQHYRRGASPGATVTHSAIKHGERGKGYGKLLYTLALAHHQNLESDANVSPRATKTWSSLFHHGERKHISGSLGAMGHQESRHEARWHGPEIKEHDTIHYNLDSGEVKASTTGWKPEKKPAQIKPPRPTLHDYAEAHGQQHFDFLEGPKAGLTKALDDKENLFKSNYGRFKGGDQYVDADNVRRKQGNASDIAVVGSIKMKTGANAGGSQGRVQLNREVAEAKKKSKKNPVKTFTPEEIAAFAAARGEAPAPTAESHPELKPDTKKADGVRSPRSGHTIKQLRQLKEMGWHNPDTGVELSPTEGEEHLQRLQNSAADKKVVSITRAARKRRQAKEAASPEEWAGIFSNLKKGEHGDWKKEGYKIKSQHVKREGRTDLRVNAYHSSGKLVGSARFIDHGEHLAADNVWVQPEHQRKGLATAMYDHAERRKGVDVVSGGDTTGDAKAFWDKRLGLKKGISQGVAFEKSIKGAIVGAALAATGAAAHVAPEPIIAHPHLNSDLTLLSQIESSGGRNIHHPLIHHGLNAGTHAAGLTGLTPLTAHEAIVHSPALQKYGHLLKLKPAEMTEALNKDHAAEAEIANTHWEHLNKVFKNDHARKAYAWYKGINAAAHATHNQIQGEPYVKKFLNLRGEHFQKSDDGDYDKETALIRENRVKPENLEPHPFEAAKWTFKNGHPRCLRCGDEERTGGICTDARERAVRDGLLKAESTGEQPTSVEAEQKKKEASEMWARINKYHPDRSKPETAEVTEKLEEIKKTLSIGHGAMGPPTSLTGGAAAGGIEATHPAYQTLSDSPSMEKMSFRQLRETEERLKRLRDLVGPG